MHFTDDNLLAHTTDFLAPPAELTGVIRRAGLVAEPLAVTKRQAFQSTAMPKMVQRWLFHRWVKIVRPGGRGCQTIIDFASLQAAYARLLQGEVPPPLPSETKRSNAGPTVRRRSE